MRLRWMDGSADTVLVVPLGPFVYRRIAELADAKMTPTQIATRLNEEDLRTLKGTSWTRPTVEGALRRIRKLRGR